VVHVPLENNADNLTELENIENMLPPDNVSATNIPPSDASTHSANNHQANVPPALFSPAPTIQYPAAKRMVRELQPHLMDPIENQDPVETEITQELENVRVTRSRKGAMDLGDAHATMAYLAMCTKFDDFSEFAMMAIEKYDLKVSLTQAQFSNIP